MLFGFLSLRLQVTINMSQEKKHRLLIRAGEIKSSKKNTFMQYISHEPREKKNAYSPLYWLFNKDPYFMVYEIIPT